MIDPMTGTLPAVEELKDDMGFNNVGPTLSSKLFQVCAQELREWYQKRGHKTYPADAPFLTREKKMPANTRLILTYPSKGRYVVLRRDPGNLTPPTVEYSLARFAVVSAKALKKLHPESTFVVARALRSECWWEYPHYPRNARRKIAPRDLNPVDLADSYAVIFTTDLTAKTP